jgi:hypothetical protein
VLVNGWPPRLSLGKSDGCSYVNTTLAAKEDATRLHLAALPTHAKAIGLGML